MGILIIDDTDFDRNLLRSILASAGYEIAGLANCGEEGIRQYEALAPQLVMLDLIMPDLNGIEVLRRIRAEHPDAKVMMCTSVGEENMVTLARKMGARGYVVKPYIAENLLSAVKKIIGPPGKEF
ncbi:response regulator [Methanospirillum sp. J.3.6.1-F.2.7.3]|uniref:Response regulator n=2 Tax=Methanospirillum TaxID=2202 RepID=A0A8E7AYS7_9EURY|nr:MULTISPECIES: response regulator [Methanospirillum]MDX8549441.1 response regulator [Methanospirillum hungatei]QVV89275.1 response regulator [Methanospirillum sp. J.3.6.1-F.2.7.3]QXO93487.1 response regulator [Methanospirillum hungatei]